MSNQVTGSSVITISLNNGTRIPVIGMGCWMGNPGGGERIGNMLNSAIALGYRHFDTASGYGNEDLLGKSLKTCGIPREQLYIVTKFSSTSHHRVREAFEESLDRLNCGYIDLYLMHSPPAILEGRAIQPNEYPTIVDTWVEMEKLLETGKVKSIGVSNFTVKTLSRLLDDPRVRIVPAVNQVEMHPYFPQMDLKEYCLEKGIVLTAYSPLGQPSSASSARPNLLTDDSVLSLCERYGASSAQILLSWGIQRGTVVIPKTENVARMKENMTPVILTVDDMAMLDNLHRQKGKHRSLLPDHEIGIYGPGLFGWSYEMLGLDGMREGGVVDL